MRDGLSIAIACHPTFGGSGIIATEIGLAMAAAGHQVHFVGHRRPARLDVDTPGVHFHAVRPLEYPVLDQAPYAIALASALVGLAQSEGLDLIHSHYAVPHATSAWMAAEVLGSRAPKSVTTLHGTDITLVGADPSYLPITRHSIVHSDAVTVPSAWLRDQTWARFDLTPDDVPIDVLPNFVDTETWRPLSGTSRPELAALFGPDRAAVPTVVHASNFRPLKQVDQVVEVFAHVAAQQPCQLVLIGDGPVRAQVERQIAERGLSDRVRLLGAVERFEALLRECAVFLLPSRTESFGLAALEAASCGVPVVATRVGGLPEVIRDGETGLLVALDDVDAMVQAVLGLVRDEAKRSRFARAARTDAVARFDRDGLVAGYQRLYERVLERS